jgi:hypothetical protein
MSIATLKKKSAVVNSKNHSNRGAELYWVGPRDAPFEYGKKGFSINGPTRNVGYIGKNMKFSKAVTPFKGVLPVGNGGSGGKYNQSTVIYNVTDSSVEVKGQQLLYNKSSVVSTYGMLRGKYKWAYTGQFPHYWVQPDANNGGYNNSQRAYIEQKSSANDCVNDTNDSGKYVDNVHGFNEKKGRLDCKNNYSKSLHQPVDSSIHTLRIQHKCANPTPEQHPFPYAVNNGGCNVYVYEP